MFRKCVLQCHTIDFIVQITRWSVFVFYVFFNFLKIGVKFILQFPSCSLQRSAPIFATPEWPNCALTCSLTIIFFLKRSWIFKYWLTLLTCNACILSCLSWYIIVELSMFKYNFLHSKENIISDNLTKSVMHVVPSMMASLGQTGTNYSFCWKPEFRAFSVNQLDLPAWRQASSALKIQHIFVEVRFFDVFTSWLRTEAGLSSLSAI